MRVGHIVPSLEERHGGPSKSVRTLANAQAAHATISLFATLGPGQPPVLAQAGERVPIETFPRQWPERICRSGGLRTRLLAEKFDCVHHHGLWLRTLHYARIAAQNSGAPLVISPRGMFSGWAYAHHRGRKGFAESFIHPRAFARASGWHATSEEEANEIRRRGHRQPVCVSPNGVNVPSEAQIVTARAVWHELCPAGRQRPVALFYSRFHRKKRVRELLDLWLSASRGDWLLLLVGVPEEYSVAEINDWIAEAGGSDRARVFDGTALPPPYAIASLFLLPSHSENFGLVVAEALAAGVPVLTTDTTPWQGLEKHRAGWCASWTGFAQTLAQALESSSAELATMGARGRDWVAREFTWEQAGRSLLDFYARLRHG
jgi:glycosyltransferase involved in cell wall biosynthesis